MVATQAYELSWAAGRRLSGHSDCRKHNPPPGEPGCLYEEDGNAKQPLPPPRHYGWQPGDIILASTGQEGILGYWGHSLGIVASNPTADGVTVIALPPWGGGEEKVGWQEGVTAEKLDSNYADWVVLRVKATNGQRSAAVSWAGQQIDAPFVSMYPRALVWAMDSLELGNVEAARPLEEYSELGWLDGGPGYYCFELPIEAYKLGANVDITGRTTMVEYTKGDPGTSPSALLIVQIYAEGWPYTGDEIFASPFVFSVTRKQ